MQITRQADYALRAILYLARHEMSRHEPDWRPATTSKIAEKKLIPTSFLAKIISQLQISGLVKTDRGARGGVALARKPEEISLLEVVEAIDGPITLNECTQDPSNCLFGDSCPLHEIWCESQAELVARLRAATFDKLLAREQAKAQKASS
jgi:Rrf2 family protein